MTRLIRALIDTAALRHNLGTIRAYAPGARVMAVVKANAYGHGLVSTALALAEERATPDGAVLVTGSLFLVGEAYARGGETLFETWNGWEEVGTTARR